MRRIFLYTISVLLFLLLADSTSYTLVLLRHFIFVPFFLSVLGAGSWLCQLLDVFLLGIRFLTLFIPGFLGWCSTGGGCFPPPPCNSLVFKVRRLQFCTELLLGRINVLGQEKSGSNR